MSKILIDAGRSSRGWSRIGSFFRCPQLFAYQNRLNMSLIPADALTRGSMGHVIQAHQHAIWGAATGNGVWVDETRYENPSVFFEPEEAIQVWCDTNGGHEHLDRMIETFHRYMDQFPECPGDVISVEYPMTAVLGHKNNEWGLWVVHQEDQDFNRRACSVKAWDGSKIIPTVLNCPGHPNSGEAVVLTRRLDMVIRDRSGKVFIWDHKHQARVGASKSVDGYAIDGGFSAFRIMGKQVYGSDFGGVALNLIQTQAPWKIARPMVPATPHRDNHFADMLWRAEHSLARLDLELPAFWDWPKAQHETVCVGRYGACPAMKMCFYGEAAKI
jgi:hypothetical protein